MNLLREVLLSSMTLMEDIIFVLFFFFFVLYIYMLYTQLNNVCILKNISLFYKEDLVSRCIYIHIKVYMYITYFRISKLKFIFSYTHIYIFLLFLG